MKLNKKQLSLISLGLMGLALLLWLVMAAVKVTTKAGSFEASETYSGIKAVFGIKEEGEKLVGFNIVGLVALCVAVCAAALAFKGEKAAPAIAVLAAVLFIVVGFTMPLGYSSEMKQAIKLIKDLGGDVPMKWGPAAGSYIAAILALGSAALQVFGPKFLLAEEAPAE